MMGSLIAKFLGVFREFYVLSYLEFSQEYSYYLSLIAILSLFTVLGNISILNPILFPIWIKFNQITLPFITSRFIATILTICLIIGVYNLYIISSSHKDLSLIVGTTLILLPLIINSFLYSALIFQEKYKEFSIIAIGNAGIYLITTFLLINQGVHGYLQARWITLIFTSILLLVYLDNKKISYKTLIPISYEQSLDALKALLSVNLVLWFSAILKVTYSLIGSNTEISYITYALIIALSFYTVVGKNINTYALKFQLIDNFKQKNALILNIAMFIIFIGGLFIFRLALTSKLSTFLSSYININDLILTVNFAIILSPVITFLGYYDLLNQSKIRTGISNLLLIKTTSILFSSIVFSRVILKWIS